MEGLDNGNHGQSATKSAVKGCEAGNETVITLSLKEKERTALILGLCRKEKNVKLKNVQVCLKDLFSGKI